MAGVTGPALRRDAAGGMRLLAGYLAGAALATVVLVSVLTLVGQLTQAVLPAALRLAIAVGGMLLLGVLDVLGRTPHLRRQTPQQLHSALSGGVLGFAWGFDIGLVFTTIRTTSLLWIVMLWAVLMDAGAILFSLASYALTSYVLLVATAVRSPYGPSAAAVPPPRPRRLLFRLASATVAVAAIAIALPR